MAFFVDELARLIIVLLLEFQETMENLNHSAGANPVITIQDILNTAFQAPTEYAPISNEGLSKLSTTIN